MIRAQADHGDTNSASAPRARWLDEGLGLLATSGIGAVTIEALCGRLGLSKGSFYHHFKSMAGYKAALLERFEQLGTQAFIDLVESAQMPDGVGKLRRLIDAVVADDRHDALEAQIRIWASQEDVAHECLERIDRRRVDFLQRQCRAIAGNTALADDVAQMIYLVLIGANHLVPPVLMADRARLWDRLITCLEPESNRASGRNERKRKP
jgi:AcrR family transcriptional regulator